MNSIQQAKPSLNSKWWMVGLFLAIGFVALFLRTYQLSSVGIHRTDEAEQFHSPKRIVERIQSWGQESQPRSLTTDTRSRYYFKPFVKLFSGRPTSDFVMIIGFFILGVSTHHFLLINTLFGFATVLLIYLTARKLEKEGPYAFCVMLALATSGFHLIWSRSGYAHVMGTFFLLLSYYAYLHGVWNRSKMASPWLMVSGASFCAGVGSHQVVVPYIGGLMLAELFRVYGQTKGRWKDRFKDTALAFLDILLPVLCGGLVFVVIAQAFTAGGFLETTIELATEAKGFNRTTLPMLLSGYVRMPFLYGEGVLVSLLVLAGIVMTGVNYWHKRLSRDLLLLCGFLVPIYLLLRLESAPLARNVAPLTIFMALLAGVSMAAIWDRVRHKAFRVLLICFFVSAQWLQVSHLFSVKSGIVQAQQWLAEQGGAVAIHRHAVSSLWDANGINELYFMGTIEDEVPIEYLRVDTGRKETRDPQVPLYLGTYNTNETHMTDAEKSWFDRIRQTHPIAEFSGAEVFTHKKMQMLRHLSWIAKRLGQPSLAQKAENQLLRLQEYVAQSQTVRLYRLDS